MGFSVKFNWVLQIDLNQSLKEQGAYPFEKIGNRVFPIDTPIDLIDMERNALAKIKITSFLNQYELTKGVFEVVKIYTGEEKTVLSRYWVENK